MREIKFRAWDKKEKRMIGDIQKAYDGMEDGCLNGKYYGYVSCFDDFLEDENFVVMQYIGKKDENNKEIYEGDICLVSCNYFEVKKYQKSKVIFKDGCFCFQYGKCWLIETYSVWDLGSIEVIGNIYENPGLLKEGE